MTRCTSDRLKMLALDAQYCKVMLLEFYRAMDSFKNINTKDIDAHATFKPLLDMMEMKEIPSRYLPITLWTSTYKVMEILCLNHQICNSLETTLYGYIMNEMYPCDTSQTAGVVFKSKDANCKDAKMNVQYWNAASRRFAESVTNEKIFMFVSALNKPLVHDETIAFSIEFKALKAKGIVKKLEFMVFGTDQTT
ncbi:hypothetical protein Ciccas_001456 [Cichlidogyrus casuarinus]|uniref:Uncharacterized protein n=1 Tax=Cichlidogyrus casuarinus TaxID=1844966 RepID=A0ABD2QK01_9PLAT